MPEILNFLEENRKLLWVAFILENWQMEQHILDTNAGKQLS